MPVNKLFDVGQREVIFFIYVSYLTRESTLYFLNVNKYWHDRKKWEKEANIVKGARICYCRIYHKFVNFIILNLFKERQERNVRKRVLRIIFTIKTNGGFPIFLTSTVTEIFMEMSFCTPERFPEIPGKREVTSWVCSLHTISDCLRWTRTHNLQ